MVSTGYRGHVYGDDPTSHQLVHYRSGYAQDQRGDERARIEMLESRLMGCEDSKVAMESRLDFIQADVSSTRNAMQELIAMIKRSASESRHPRGHTADAIETHQSSPHKPGTS